MKATVTETHDEFDAAGKGAIWPWRYAEKGNTNGHIMLKCPGCGSESGMHVRNPDVLHPTDRESWIITGFPDAITLKPSINCVGCCGWHGYLTNGEYHL